MHIMHDDTAGISRDAIFTVFENIGSLKAWPIIARVVGSYIFQRGCAVEELKTVVFAGFLCSSYCQVTACQAGLPEPDEKQQEQQKSERFHRTGVFCWLSGCGG